MLPVAEANVVYSIKKQRQVCSNGSKLVAVSVDVVLLQLRAKQEQQYSDRTCSQEQKLPDKPNYSVPTIDVSQNLNR